MLKRFSFFAFVAVALLVITGSCDPKPQPVVEVEAQQEGPYTPQFIEELNNIYNRRQHPDSGAFITSQQAASLLDGYWQGRRAGNSGGPYNPKLDVYGFGFGINKMMDFMRKIEAHNRGRNENDSTYIVGVRVYYAARRIRGQLVNDAFLIPIINLYFSLPA